VPFDYVRKRFSGGAGSEGRAVVVRRIKTGKRRGVLNIWYSQKMGTL